jgi:hypothetical protein
LHGVNETCRCSLPHPLLSIRWADMDETILSVLQGDDESSRILLVHRRRFGYSGVVLRRETFSDAIGWYEQSSVEMSSDEVGQLKQAIGAVAMSRVKPPKPSFARGTDTTGDALAIRMVAQGVG